VAGGRAGRCVGVQAFLLKAQKMVPLSNFAITEIEGREFYELIGDFRRNRACR
jgi:uncharacterized protein YjfI (DUF2170 family)